MTDNARTATVLTGLVRHARDPIRQHFRADSCIASTRIGLDVLAYFGVRAEPLALSVLIFNTAAIELLEGGMHMNELAEVLHDIPVSREGGPWSMGLGLGGDPEPNKWAGHLVISLPYVRTMLDLSIEQANRPHKGLHFDRPIMWFVADNEWWAGERLLSEPMMYANDETDERIMVMFDREDRNGTFRDYRQTANWNRRSSVPGDVFKPITGEIIRLIKHDLEED